MVVNYNMIDDIYIFDNIVDTKTQKHIQDIIFNKIRINSIMSLNLNKQ